METEDLLRSQRLKGHRILLGRPRPIHDSIEGDKVSNNTSSRVSRLTREHTILMQVARNFNINDGQLSTVLASGNPAEERRLATQLQRIENEKKRRESTLAWNQRNFFIKQVFDQDNELRFVRAYRRPSYKVATTEGDFEEKIKVKLKTRSNDDENILRNERNVKRELLRRSKTEHTLQRQRTTKENIQDYKIEVNDQRNDPGDKTTPEPQAFQADDNCERVKHEHAQPKTKFPLLKVRALGIFAASFRRNEIKSCMHPNKSVQLPCPTVVQQCGRERSYLSSGKNKTDVSLTATSKCGSSQDDKGKFCNDNCKHSLDDLKSNGALCAGPIHDNDVLYNTQIFSTHGNVESIRDTMTIRHECSEEDNSDQKYIGNRMAFKDNKNMKSIELILRGNTSKERRIMDETTNLKEVYCKEVKSSRDSRRGTQTEKKREHRTLEAKENEEQFQIRQDKVLRKLVSTLPTHLLIKTHRREKEAVGISMDDVRKQMIDKAKSGMSRSVLMDPRFKNLEDFLYAGKHATYNPRRSSQEISEIYNID